MQCCLEPGCPSDEDQSSSSCRETQQRSSVSFKHFFWFYIKVGRDIQCTSKYEGIKIEMRALGRSHPEA